MHAMSGHDRNKMCCRSREISMGEESIFRKATSRGFLPVDFDGRLVLILFCSALVFALAAASQARVHTGFYGSSYGGAAECASCHFGVGEDQLMDSAHFSLKAPPEAGKEIVGGGEHGMLDIFCSVEMGYLPGAYAQHRTGVITDEVVAIGCGQCHIGRLAPLPSNDRQQEIDCLICHAGNYDFSTREVVHSTPDGPVWGNDSSLAAAESVGGPVTSDACLCCHRDAFSGLKRGTPFNETNDVHAAEGLSCVYCHSRSRHKFSSGGKTIDLFVRERPYVTISCENCHGQGEHTDSEIDSHVPKIACQACHIPKTCGLTKMLWAPIPDSDIPGERDVPIHDSSTDSYVPYREFSPGFDLSNLDALTGAMPPTYRWHDPDNAGLGWPRGSRFSPDSKLFAFKRIEQGLLFDADLSMADFYDEFDEGLRGAGLVRSTGLTPGERDQLANIPMLLSPDPAHYASYGGEPTGLERAINLGLGRLKNELYDLGLTSDDEIAEAGAALWSGSFYASYERQDADLPITGDYFSLNHGVRRADEALSCEACHKADSPIDFASIGYTPSEEAYYESFLSQTPAVLAASDRTSYQSHETISLKFACYNHGEGLTADVYYAVQLRAARCFTTRVLGPSLIQRRPFTSITVSRCRSLRFRACLSPPGRWPQAHTTFTLPPLPPGHNLRYLGTFRSVISR